MTPTELLDRYAEGDPFLAEDGPLEHFSRDEAAPELIRGARAVLDLHPPYDPQDLDISTACSRCRSESGELDVPWPCEEVRAISSALEAS